jgi:hypothetical protein
VALGDPYVTLAELRAYLKFQPQVVDRDTILEDAAAAASQEIERICRRQFNRTDTATARVFTAPGGCHPAYVDDFYSTDGLVVETDIGSGTFGDPWSDANFELEPMNGVYEGQPGWPFYKIRPRNRSFPLLYRRNSVLRVTAKWGWAQVPRPIRQATLLQAAHLYKMSDAPNGVAGMDQFGAVRIRSLPQVEDLVCAYKANQALVG